MLFGTLEKSFGTPWGRISILVQVEESSLPEALLLPSLGNFIPVRFNYSVDPKLDLAGYRIAVAYRRTEIVRDAFLSELHGRLPVFCL